MGQRQSGVQVFALMLLLLSALVMEGIVPVEKIFSFLKGDSPDAASDKEAITKEWNARHMTYGVVPIMIASFISGLAGALTQIACKQSVVGAIRIFLVWKSALRRLSSWRAVYSFLRMNSNYGTRVLETVDSRNLDSHLYQRMWWCPGWIGYKVRWICS
jgi:hypothetical protein